MRRWDPPRAWRALSKAAATAIRRRAPAVPHGPLAATALLLLVTIATAALLPVGGASPGVARGGVAELPTDVRHPAPPDLTPFLTNRRWGVSVLDERRKRVEQQEARAAAEQPAEPNPLALLQAIGFVGVAVNEAEQAVLLTVSDGAEVVRHRPGEALADGRVLVAVREEALVLERSDGSRETLALFPVALAP